MRTRTWLQSGMLISGCLVGAAALGQQPEPASTLPPVKVRLATLGTPTQFSVKQAAGDLRVLNGESGTPLAVKESILSITGAGNQVKVGVHAVRTLRVEGSRLTVRVGKTERDYPEALLVTASQGRLTILNECSLEQYTAGVLAGECPALFHPEAIRALAVAVRSYSYRKAFLAAQPGKEMLCDTTHCQVYKGASGVAESIRNAVRDTDGQCVTHEGEIIDAVYSADCGGYTEANEAAWKGKPVPYLRPVEDAPEPNGEPFCSVNRSHQWNLTIPHTRLRSLLGKTTAPVAVSVAEMSGSGRVLKLQLAPVPSASSGGKGATPASRVITGTEWRQMFGPSTVRSLRFTMEESDTGIELRGRGYGHGVGLCQFGANGMGRMGYAAEEIVQHYYTDCRIEPVPPVEVARARHGGRRASGGAIQLLSVALPNTQER